MLSIFEIKTKNIIFLLITGISVACASLYLTFITKTWFLCFTIGLSLFMFALFARIQQGSWLVPGAFFSLYWSMFVLLALILMPNFDIKIEGLFWIFLSVFAVYIGSIIGLNKMFFKAVSVSNLKKKNKFSIYQKFILNFPWLNQILIFCSILGISAAVILILHSNQGVSSLFSLEAFSKMARGYSIARYSDPTYREPSVAIFLFIFIYLGAFFGGIRWALAQSKYHRILALFPLLSATLVGSVLTTRASLYFTIIIWLSAYLAIYVALNKGVIRLFTFRDIIIISILIILITSIFIGFLMFRYNILTTDTQPLVMLYNKTKVDVFGSLPAFTFWFEQHWKETIKPTFGAFTFGHPLEWLGIVKSLRHKTIALSSKYSTYHTNVFTLLRKLANDFTLVGSIIFLFFTGILGGFSFRKVIQDKILYLPILIAFYGITLCSFSGSLFNYTTILLAWIIFIVYLIFIKFGQRIKKKIIKKY